MLSRRLAAVVGLLLLTACGPRLRHVAPQTYVSGIDFRPHMIDGFLFSPNPFMADHDVIGLVTVGMEAEMNFVAISNGFQEWQDKPIPIDSILARATRRVLDLGGDALVNFSIRQTSEVRSVSLSVPGIEVSGLAIARAP